MTFAVIGPNTIGVSNAFARFTSSFIEVHHDETPVGIVSQSGLFMMGHHLINNEPGGFSMSIDLGNGCDIDVVDVLDYYGQEPAIEVIQCHVEGIARGTAFIETAARVSRRKPIVALKAGKTESGQQAVASHSGAAAGEAAVYEAAFRKAGVVVAENAEDASPAHQGVHHLPTAGGQSRRRHELLRGRCNPRHRRYRGGGTGARNPRRIDLRRDARPVSGLDDGRESRSTSGSPSPGISTTPFPASSSCILQDEGVDAVICIYCSYTMPKYTAFDSARHIPDPGGRSIRTSR